MIRPQKIKEEEWVRGVVRWKWDGHISLIDASYGQVKLPCGSSVPIYVDQISKVVNELSEIMDKSDNYRGKEMIVCVKAKLKLLFEAYSKENYSIHNIL